MTDTRAPARATRAPTFRYIGLADDPPTLADYTAAWELQRDVHRRVASGESGPVVLFVEHPPVYTAGTKTLPAERPFDGTPVVDVDRGGKITYHGPGQLVGYPIVGLPREVGPLGYVRRLEEAVLRGLRTWSIEGGRVAGRTGVWLPAASGRPERKICAIGIRVARQTTMHGFALNVTAASPGPFGNIVPCGIADAGVTSIEDETAGPTPSLLEVAAVLEPLLAEALSWAPLAYTGFGADDLQRL